MTISDEDLVVRDAKERADTCYCQFTRCCGGHVTPAGYVCHHCDSNDPSVICFKEKVRTKEEKPNDYTDPKVRRRVKKFRVI